ncbi:hypothetical protein QBC38DRAFT_469550 [Podospora fimiseda]|uniref:CID domain-containing protein n=1 Tax=Podospora fimiseda TaxID=252190 RepID=A0AAN7BVM4_9PEZI|nr:hypothetical protein QBC38DRAFT_469550 [Podospora fimiseda]
MASASAELTVAKAALTGVLFRAEPTPCSRSDIESMLDLLNSTVAECSPPNVQRCKQWALSNLVPSSARVASFCKYLVALSKSFGSEKDVLLQTFSGRVPSAKRRRLHLLYVLNDILFHTKYRTQDTEFAQKIEPTLSDLIRHAASFRNCPKHIRKIQDLVALWEEEQYFSEKCIQDLNTAIESPDFDDQDCKEASVHRSAVEPAKSEPYLLPATHGDPSTPWYDLPAGNWLPLMEPNSIRPMNPYMIKPLVLAKGPAEKGLVDAVKKLLNDVDRIYYKETDHNKAFQDFAQTGEIIETDEFTGEIIGGETYYGWSRAFCENMKARRRNGDRSIYDDQGRGRSRSTRSYSRSDTRDRSQRPRYRNDVSSRSSSRPAFKRPRSDSEQSHTSQNSRRRRYRSNGRRSRSPTRSRSRSRTDRRHSRSSSGGSRYEPRSPSYSPMRSRTRSRSWSSSQPGRSYDNNNQHNHINSFSHASHPHQQAPPPPPHAMGYPHVQMPNFSGGFPVPPPPPPNFGGPWGGVPPHPPLMGLGVQQQPPPHFFPPGAGDGNIVVPPPPQFGGTWVPPQNGYHPQQPPPPPPGHYQNNHYNQGRGAGNGTGYRGNGRGGFGRGSRW